MSRLPDLRSDARAAPDRTPAPLPAWLLVPGALLWAVSLALFLVSAKIGGYDFSVYMLGGEAFRDGLPVYDQVAYSTWGVGYFTYPPVTLLVFWPMSNLPYAAAYVIMFVVEIGAVLAAVWLTLRMIGYRPGRGTVGALLGSAGAALWLQPIFDSVHEGKIEIILMVLVLADFALDGRRRWPSGVLVGVAAAMKITPGIFILFLLLTRRYRAALTAAVTWAVLTGLGFALAWSDSVRFWFEGTFADADRVASPLTVDSVFNQSIHSVTLRLLGSGWSDVWYLFAFLVAVGGLAVAVMAYRRVGPLAGLLACALTGLLISPVSWHEHWVWMVPVLIFLAYLGWRFGRHRMVLAVALPALVGVVFLIWPLPTGEPGQWGPASMLSPASHMWFDEGNRHPLVALATAAYVLVGLVLLVAAAGALRSSWWRRSAAADGGLPRPVRSGRRGGVREQGVPDRIAADAAEG